LLFENWLIVVRHSSGTARTEALLAAFTRRRVDRDRRGDALAHARRRRAALVWVVLAAALKQDAARCGASLFLLSPVVVLVSRLLFGRRFVRDGPSPACIATGDARAMHAARVRHGWFSPPQSSTDVARVVLSSPLFFSRSVAPRAALPRSTRMPAGGRAHHKRARGARDARRDARGVWGVRAQSALGARGPCFARVWCSSPPLFSRSVAPRAALPRSTHTPAGARASRAGARRMRRATRRARRVGVRAPRALGVRGPGSRERPSWASLGLPPAPRALLLRSLRSPRPPAGGACAPRTGARRTRREVRRTRRAGTPREVRFPLSRFAVRACSLSFAPLLTARRAAPSLPAEEARSRERAHDARAISRVGVALRVCLWFVCASFRDLARRAARSCALVLRKT
jgi:hypothetical protein